MIPFAANLLPGEIPVIFNVGCKSLPSPFTRSTPRVTTTYTDPYSTTWYGMVFRGIGILHLCVSWPLCTRGTARARC